MKIFLTVIWTIFWAALGYLWFMPTISLTFGGGLYWYLAIYFGVLGCCMFEDGEISKNTIVTWIPCAALLVSWLLISIFGTWAAFQSKNYRNLIGTVSETKFTANIAPISANDMIIVDEEIARRVAEKELGSDPGLGSRASVGDFHLQSIAGKLFWIAPLEHSGFWKWNRFSDQGTPGYLKVSATNQEDYELVTKVANQPIKIRYQTGAFFGQDLTRHIYMSGYMGHGMTDYTFEVDDEGNPFWSITLYDTKIGFSGSDAIAVLLIHPETGEIKRYSIEETPAFIDRIQPEEFVASQVDDWGEFIHGWPNWSGNEKLTACPERSIVMGNDHKPYFYIGLQSKGSENSTVGFMLVNTRTKEAKWFRQNGATETAAKASAEGKVQQMGYVGSDGICYNIGGVPTYEFLLKDKGGLMKLIALVKVHDHTVVGIGETRQEAIRDYQTSLTNRGNAASVQSSDMRTEVLESRVKRVVAETERGSTNYYLILEGKKGVIFVGRSTISMELPLTQPGDTVLVRFIESDQQQINLVDFRNHSLNLTKDAQQSKKEREIDKVREESRNESEEKVNDTKWENLSQEDKRKLLEGKKGN